MLSWDHCRVFLAVIREGSLSAAARHLDLTQTTLGRQLDAMEEALGGVRLFTRSHRGLLPTDVALALVAHAETMANAALAMTRAASSPAAAASGVVRITASEIVGAELLPSVLADLSDAHTGLKFELMLSNDVDDLLRREADIALRMTEPTQHALVRRKVGSVSIGFFAHPRYIAKHGAPRDMKGLAKHRIIGFDRDIGQLKFIGSFDLGFEPQEFALRVDNNVAQFTATRAGFGIGVCQVGLSTRAGLVRVLPKVTVATLPLWVVMHEDQRKIARVRTVYEGLAAGLGKLVD